MPYEFVRNKSNACVWVADASCITEFGRSNKFADHRAGLAIRQHYARVRRVVSSEALLKDLDRINCLLLICLFVSLIFQIDSVLTLFRDPVRIKRSCYSAKKCGKCDLRCLRLGSVKCLFQSASCFIVPPTQPQIVHLPSRATQLMIVQKLREQF